MKISLIVAATKNGVIGRDNQMPWHLPEDLKYFKRVTMGKPVVMGRKTYESIGRPLPGRTNIVVSRQEDWQPGSEVAVGSVVSAVNLDFALDKAKAIAAESGAEEVMVIGGAQIYRASMSVVDRVYLTEIATELEGDAYFPLAAIDGWQEVGRESYQACDKNPYDYDFVVYERVKVNF